MTADLSRRHLLVGAAATAAVAAMPAAALAAVEETAVAVTYLDPAGLEWRPGSFYRMRQLITVAGRWHVVMLDHMSEDRPSERFLSRPLSINSDGWFEEEAVA